MLTERCKSTRPGPTPAEPCCEVSFQKMYSLCRLEHVDLIMSSDVSCQAAEPWKSGDVRGNVQRFTTYSRYASHCRRAQSPIKLCCEVRGSCHSITPSGWYQWGGAFPSSRSRLMTMKSYYIYSRPPYQRLLYRGGQW